jgi:hypothetical protein
MTIRIFCDLKKNETVKKLWIFSSNLSVIYSQKMTDTIYCDPLFFLMIGDVDLFLITTMNFKAMLAT